MSTKTWTSKADWDGGTLDDLYCPIGLAQLEIAYDILTGKATYIFNAERMVNWISFGHTKENTKTVWRDDFRVDSLSRYTIYGNNVTHDSVNKRLSCMPTGFDSGGVILPATVSIKNVKAQADFYFTASNQDEWGPMTYVRCRNPDANNLYASRHAGTGCLNTTRILKNVGGVPGIVITDTWLVPWNVWRTHHFDLNESSLKSWTDEGEMAPTDSDLLIAGQVAAYFGYAQGYMDNILVQHYTMPSPANNSISFRFAVSSDNVHWNPWVTDFANCGNSRYIKVEVTLSRNSLASAMPVLKDMTMTYETRKQQPIFI